MKFISFISEGRTGNILFQYLTCKLFYKTHKYISKNEFDEKVLNDDYMLITEENIINILNDEQENISKHLLCKGYFQKSNLFVSKRSELLNLLYDESNKDYFIHDNNIIYINKFLKSKHSLQLQNDDIVISLRLDDFIQLPCETSDIIPPQFYLYYLFNSIKIKQRIYIICDTIRYEWEREYIKFFTKYENVILIQEDIFHDCAVFRDCPILIHSNSTLCWIMSFLSFNYKIRRIIPNTNFYKNQSLGIINEKTDIVVNIFPLLHNEVYSLNICDNYIYPITYSIPDEYIVKEIPEKKNMVAFVNPYDKSTYIFNSKQEKEYRDMYKQSRFAITCRKGGWDCLRHYEIMSNGCIPLFQYLEDCPYQTLSTYPKHLNKEGFIIYENWNCDENNSITKYNNLCERYLTHLRKNCTTSSISKYIISKMINKNNKYIRNILLLTCDPGINYLRELTYIGLKRYIQSIGGVAVEYPHMPFLYTNYNDDIDNLYGLGFTYTKKINPDYTFTEEEILEKIRSKFWDIIIYGKVGHDDIFSCPYWDIVRSRYNKNNIIFLYGGDGLNDMTDNDNNNYKKHLEFYSNFGTCFVRELKE